MVSSSVSYTLDGFTSDAGSLVFPSTIKRKMNDLWNSGSVRLLLNAAKCFGVFLSDRKRLQVSFCARLWQTLLLLVAILVALIDTWKSVSRFRSRLTSLEFTAIAMAIYRFIYVFRGIMAIIHLHIIAGIMGRLFYDVNRVCMDMSPGGLVIRQKIKNLAVVLFMACITSLLAVLLADYICFLGIVNEALKQDPDCGWSCPTSYPLFGMVPTWVTFLSYFLGFFFEIGIQVFPQCVMFLLICAIALRFKNLADSIKDILVDTENDYLFLDPEALRQKAFQHLELSKIVARFDVAFSFIFFLAYAHDFMGFIATASLVLHHRNGLTSGNNIDLQLLPLFLSTMGVQCVSATFRTGFSIWINEKAHSVLPYLYELNLRVQSQEERFLCTSFIARLQGPRIALTAGGFFYITREFVITIFGVLLTYVMFVYQMQDQKYDLASLPKLADIASLAFSNQFHSQLPSKVISDGYKNSSLILC